LSFRGFQYASHEGSNCFAFIPPDQQNNENYSQYGVFWLYNWFQKDNDNMNIYFLMNGNIFGSSLALGPYSLSWCPNGECYAIPPNPPASTINGEPIFVKSYINAYETAFNQSTPGFSGNYQKALYNYVPFTYGDVNNNFVPGTFGFKEEYYSLSQSQPFIVHHLQDDASLYAGTSYLFVSAGSGGGSGFMYLDWIIVTYGVPYVVNVS
jgi:hypothetical protein